MSNTGIESQLKEITDRRQIHEVLITLASAIDRNDRERMLACYHPEAIDDHGEFSGPVEGFVEWIDRLYRERLQAMSHQINNHHVELDGDQARCETYVTVFMAARPFEGQRMQMIGVGRYLDRFERRDGVWRIAQRTVLTDWQQMQAFNDDPEQALITRLHHGLASREDPSYAHLPSLR